jgi:hypothetical protein
MSARTKFRVALLVELALVVGVVVAGFLNEPPNLLG